MNRFLLVLTACIDPGRGEYQLHRADPAIRLEDYKAALRFWLRFADQRVQDVLFIENSAYPLEALKSIAETENIFEKRIEFVSLDCNWYPPGGHYGYAELRMLDLGLQQSELRSATTHMIKVSGRLKFPSLTRLLDRLPKDFAAAADARAWASLHRRLETPYVTTQIILFGNDFYRQHLQDCYRELENGRESHMEAVYYRKLAEQAPSNKVIFRFPCNVPPVGIPAHRNRSYTHPSQLLFNGFRSLSRRVLPDWWI